MTDWLARIDVDGNFLAAYRAKRAAVVAVSAAYVAFWAWLAFVIGFAAVFVLVNSGATSSNNWNAPSGVTPALAIGALCAVVAGAVAAGRAILTWRHGAERAMEAVSARPAGEDDRRLIDIIAELCLAGGQKVPAVYVIESDVPNALSAPGRRPCIAVTTGLCESLSRAELAAVIGHELTHLRYRDGILQLFVSVLVRPMDDESETLERSGRGILLFFPALICWGLASLLGRYASTGQEELTDLNSLELTRDPSALADALDKMRRGRGSLGEGEATVAQLLTVPPAETDHELGRRIAALRELTA